MLPFIISVRHVSIKADLKAIGPIAPNWGPPWNYLLSAVQVRTTTHNTLSFLQRTAIIIICMGPASPKAGPGDHRRFWLSNILTSSISDAGYSTILDICVVFFIFSPLGYTNNKFVLVCWILYILCASDRYYMDTKSKSNHNWQTNRRTTIGWFDHTSRCICYLHITRCWIKNLR